MCKFRRENGQAVSDLDNVHVDVITFNLDIIANIKYKSNTGWLCITLLYFYAKEKVKTNKK
jgi:hypothetical protein